MFHRANSSERIERKGRYTRIITEQHTSGVYESREIFIALLQGYLDYQKKVLNSVVSLRGSVFRHAQLIEDLKNHLLQLDEDSYAAPLIRWFNRHYFNLNPNDDIFYLLNAFFSIYENHVVKVNSVLDERITIENSWPRRLEHCDETMLGFIDVIFYPNIPTHQVGYLVNFIKQRPDTLTAKRVGEVIKSRITSKELILSPALLTKVYYKLSLLFPVLTNSDIDHFVNFIFCDFEANLPNLNQQILENFMNYVEGIHSYLPSLSDENINKLFQLLVYLCQHHNIYNATMCFIKARICFSDAQMDEMHEVLIGQLPVVDIEEKIDICGALVMLDAIKCESTKDLVHAILVAFLTKEGNENSFALVLAARHFFLCKELTSNPIRRKMIAALQAKILNSTDVYVKAELAILLLKENEKIALSIENIENDFPLIVDKSEDTVLDVINKLKCNLYTGVQTDYTCKLIFLLSKLMTSDFKNNLIKDEISVLMNGFDEKSLFILIAFRHFINEMHYEDLFDIVIVFIAESTHHFDNIIFINFIIELKEILPQHYLVRIAETLFSLHNSRIDSYFCFLLREYQEYFTSNQCYSIYQRFNNSIVSFGCNTVEDGLSWYRTTADTLATLQTFTNKLSFNQLVRQLNMTAYLTALPHYYADFIFSDLYHHYHNHLNNDRLLRLRGESGRQLPPEIVQDIITMSNRMS